MIRVVYVVPGAPPVVKEIENTLPELQRLVGGYIQCVEFGLNARIFRVLVQEDALLAWDFEEPDLAKQRVQPNRWVVGHAILGPFLVLSGATTPDGDFTSMTEEESAGICSYIEQCAPLRASEIREPGFELLFG